MTLPIKALAIKTFPTKKSVLLFVALALSQASCNLLPEAQSLRLFMLPTQSTARASASEAKLSLELRVRTLQAGRVLASSRIAVVPEGNEITVYRGVRWTDPAPILVRDRLLEAFQNAGRLQAVYSEENRLQADIELSGVLKVFQSEYIEGRVQVRIQMDLRLTDPGGRQLLADRRFEVTEDSDDGSIEQVVASFGRAGDVLSQQVVEWALNEIAASKN